MNFDGDAIVSIRCTWKFFASHYGYDIVVFHTLDDARLQQFKDKVGDNARGELADRVKYKRIAFDWPDGIDEAYLADGRCIDPVNGVDMWAEHHSCGCTCPDIRVVNRTRANGLRCWDINYLHMNRFFTYSIWPLLDDMGYDYYMRVDADLFMQKNVPDPFAKMDSDETVFVVGYQEGDTQGCFEGQQAEVRRWGQTLAPQQGHAAYPDQIDDIQVFTCYWGGFHAGSVRFFKQPAHMALAKHINEHGGIYTNRWSDQVHFPNAVALLHKGGVSTGTSLMPFFKHECPGVECDDANPEHVFIHEHNAPDFSAKVNRRCALDDDAKTEL